MGCQGMGQRLDALHEAVLQLLHGLQRHVPGQTPLGVLDPPIGLIHPLGHLAQGALLHLLAHRHCLADLVHVLMQTVHAGHHLVDAPHQEVQILGRAHPVLANRSQLPVERRMQGAHGRLNLHPHRGLGLGQRVLQARHLGRQGFHRGLHGQREQPDLLDLVGLGLGLVQTVQARRELLTKLLEGLTDAGDQGLGLLVHSLSISCLGV